MAERYNLKNIRSLLTEGFTDEELRRLCFDMPAFRPVYDELAGHTGKAEIIDRLIEYAERKALFERLLALAQQLNPARYAIHLPYSEKSESSIIIGDVDGDIHGSIIAGRDVLIEPGKIVTEGYNVSAIRKLILTTFNDETLTTFCYDHFRTVFNSFFTKITFQDKVQLLIEYCVNLELLGQLLVLIREINPTAYAKIAPSLQISVPRQLDTKQSETWDDYINRKLLKQNYVYLDDLDLIPESKRREALKVFEAKTTYDLIYNADKSCLMYRYWPQLKALNGAWDTLRDCLNSDIDTFASQWAIFAQTLEDVLGVGPVSTPQPASRYNRIVGYKINVGSAFEGLNLPGKLLLCAAQYPQPTLAEIEGVYHLVRNQHHANIALLVLFSDSNHAQQIQLKLDRNFKRSQACDIIVLTYAEISSWLKTDSPLDEIRRTVLKQVNLKAVSPFVINGPTPENMFFGRENELRRIRDHLPHQSFAITGGRRIGKTSIAQRLHTDYLPAANFYALYQDISFIFNPEQFLAIRLDNWQPTRPTQVPATIGDLLAAGPLDRPVALLLDEADKLVPFDRKLGWPIFNQLRAAANTGYLRIILIGERQLRESMQDSRSPLFNFTNDILIGRLNFENVEKLITQPLEKLEIIYDPRIVRRIYEFTSGHPNIVQRLCQQLIEILDTRNDRKLTLDDVEGVVNNPAFQRDDFLNTYLSQATILEHILTIMLAKAGQISNLAAIRHVLRQELGLDPSARELNAALRRLVDLRSILNHTSQGYTFAVSAISLVINQSGAIATADLLEQYVEDYRTHGDKTLEEIDAMEWA
ncbi:MAG: hypothetical protein DPW09_12080 [Anaerolineae bacterium]|nr:hypothetical protein [Anaerolineales bacterium]MCQ3974177.1 hypothetical protein [Anaerolineae bacterium]